MTASSAFTQLVEGGIHIDVVNVRHTLAGAQARTLEASGARRSSSATFSRNLFAVGGSSLLVLLALTGMVFLR